MTLLRNITTAIYIVLAIGLVWLMASLGQVAGGVTADLTPTTTTVSTQQVEYTAPGGIQ